MTWVKVCGVRRLEDVEAAERAGADAIGLVMAESPRRVDLELARVLAGHASVTSFLVLVDATVEEALSMAAVTGAGGLQPHGERAAEVAAAGIEAGLTVLRPVAVGPGLDLGSIPDDQIPLLDTADPVLHGGTGRRFDLSQIGSPRRRWVMAGGLGPDNVADAVRAARPWGVDASSRLESAPGVKDLDAVVRYVEEAKQA